jgi:IclR family acetate operon transcriptional repressor
VERIGGHKVIESSTMTEVAELTAMADANRHGAQPGFPGTSGYRSAGGPASAHSDVRLSGAGGHRDAGLSSTTGHRDAGVAVAAEHRAVGLSSSSGRGVLEGAFGLLSALSEVDQAGLTALAVASGLPKATTHRLLDQLIAVGAVERAGGEYRIGPKLFQLGVRWQPHPRLIESASTPIHDFARTSGATVVVCVLRMGQLMTVSVAPGEIVTETPVRAGESLPWKTAAGRVLLANSSATNAVPRGNPMAWARHAAEIRERGMAFDQAQVLPGIWCVAVPVRHRDNEVVAALGALVPPGSPLTAVGEALHRVSHAISANLSGRPTSVAS